MRQGVEVAGVKAFRFKGRRGIIRHVQIRFTFVKLDVMRSQGFVDIAKSFHGSLQSDE